MDESLRGLAVESLDACLSAADQALCGALDELYRSPTQRRLIQEIRANTARLLRGRQVREAIAAVIGELGPERQLRILTRLRKFTNSPQEAPAPVWARLDTARAVLRDCELLSHPDMPAEVQAILRRFDVLLAGGSGEPAELWTGPVRQLEGSRDGDGRPSRA